MFAFFGEIRNPFNYLGGPDSYLAYGRLKGWLLSFPAWSNFSIVLAGIYVLINLILAGYGFILPGRLQTSPKILGKNLAFDAGAHYHCRASLLVASISWLFSLVLTPRRLL